MGDLSCQNVQVVTNMAHFFITLSMMIPIVLLAMKKEKNKMTANVLKESNILYVTIVKCVNGSKPNGKR